MAALTLNSIRLCTLALGGALALGPPALAGDVSVKLDAGAGFSIKDSTGALERLRVDEATGNLSRNGALFVHTTGTSNIFVGLGAGNTSTTGGGGNAAFGAYALRAITTGTENVAAGYFALRFNTIGGRNAALGFSALRANTTGSSNTAIGYSALRNNGSGGGNSAVGDNALSNNTSGTYNSAVGSFALSYSTTGAVNVAVGANALRVNTTGNSNSAVGFDALRYNNAGGWNSAVGQGALRMNNGGANSAFGQTALRSNTTGGGNSAFGRAALYSNTTGSGNIAVGRLAGQNQTTGNDNIYLANDGVATESGRIRIGTSPTHTATFIAGISGSSVSGSAVLVSGSGQLGVAVSSVRFKEAVEDMGDASDSLMALRPVRFRYRKDAGGDGHTQEYGLIAEEVAAIAPELVVYDEQGKPFTVRYHEMAPMLLNEMKKQQNKIEKQRQENQVQLAEIDAQRRENQAQQAEIAALTMRLARVETRVSGATGEVQR